MNCMNDNGGEAVCPICGHDAQAQNNADALPVRYWLAERYLIGCELDRNGEGITYIGWDNEEDAVVTVREYFPAGLAQRNGDHTVSILPEKEYSYNEGILEFLELSKKLYTMSDLPCLLPVVQVMEHGGTAYRVTKSISSISLREFLLRNGGTLKWEQTRPLFLPLITTLKNLHAAGVIHRGLSPETIMVGRDGKLRITGFCIRAARTSRSDMTAQLFPGFAAIEQYGFDQATKDGPWTDAYGLAATLFRVLMGNPPVEANQRVTNDTMSVPAKLAESLPPYVLSALANALQILPGDRTANMDEFRRDLMQSSDSSPVLSSSSASETKGKAKKGKDGEPKKSKGNRRYGLIAAGVTAGVLLIGALLIILPIYFRGGLFGTAQNESDDVSSVMSIPSEQQVGSNDGTGNSSRPEHSYPVPNLLGKMYSDVTANLDYQGTFTFKVVGKKFSNRYARGMICEQSPAADTGVKRDTEIQVYISLGSETVAVPSVAGLDRDDAYIRLLETGFLKDNIHFLERYDDTKTPEVVIQTEPAAGSKVSLDDSVTVYINSYKKPEPSSSSETFTNNAPNTNSPTTVVPQN